MPDCSQLILSQILVSTNVNSLGAGAVCSGVPQRVFIFVCSLVFTPLIGYQVSLVDSLAIRRLSLVVAGILDDHLTEERLGSSSFVVFNLLLSCIGIFFTRLTRIVEKNTFIKHILISIGGGVKPHL